MPREKSACRSSWQKGECGELFGPKCPYCSHKAEDHSAKGCLVVMKTGLGQQQKLCHCEITEERVRELAALAEKEE